ncbi:hypothetical protein [Oceanibacterium hippocampi]|uniref:Glycosyltransferase RgtA/B/C/D-like domain-containing protein n=1 Tax=Oceanibacterium hippocampi TaxID=745714 RepID=A0A1Y5RQD8_9PROT|nr:hypothetical protein [Oceanibacterium hippocampi]SLN22791.1 hypothetical protein OCH7691_00610 [Oceanibacterium hippocampi]
MWLVTGSLLGGLMLYGAAPLAMAALMARLLGEPAERRIRDFAVFFGLGPIAVAWLLWLSLTLLPGAGPAVHMIAASLPVLCILVAERRYCCALLADFRAAWRALSTGARLGTISLALFVIVLGLYMIVIPVTLYDPLQYITVAKQIYRDGSLLHYPPNPAVQETGLFMGASHPPGHILLFVWSFLWQGGTESYLPLRAITIFIWVAQCASIAALLIDRGRLVALLGALGISVVPLYLEMVLNAHVEPLRLYTFWTAFVTLKYALEKPGLGSHAALGASVGLALFSHSIGLLALPFVAAAYFLLAPGRLLSRNRWRSLIPVAGFTALALLIGGWQFAENTLRTGRPIGDSNPVWELPEVGQEEYLRQARNYESLDRLVIGGVLQIYSKRRPFGFIFWLVPVLVPFAIAGLRRDPMARLSVLAIAFFLAMIIASMLADSLLAIKNPRYSLTVMPFMIYLGTVSLAICWNRLQPPPGTSNGARLAVRRVAQGTFVALAIALFIASAGRTGSRLHEFGRFFDLPAFLAGDPLTALAGATESFGPSLLYVRDELPESALPLVFRQPEYLAYTGRPSIRDLDPRLIGFYRIADRHGAFCFLRRFGVDHIIAPLHDPPATYINSQAEAIVNDPALATFLATDDRFAIYRLNAGAADCPVTADSQ